MFVKVKSHSFTGLIKKKKAVFLLLFVLFVVMFFSLIHFFDIATIQNTIFLYFTLPYIIIPMSMIFEYGNYAKIFYPLVLGGFVVNYLFLAIYIYMFFKYFRVKSRNTLLLYIRYGFCLLFAYCILLLFNLLILLLANVHGVLTILSESEIYFAGLLWFVFGIVLGWFKERSKGTREIYSINIIYPCK